MQYFQAIADYSPTIISAARSIGTYIPLKSSESKTTNRTKETWIDPICALIALAILMREPEGTKLSFNDNEISFDNPGVLQPYKRHHQGNSRSDLYNLTPAIFYAIQWLNIKSNPKYTVILEVAKLGLLHMIRHTYSDDLMTQQYLTTTHLKMLKEGLAHNPISRDEFMVPDHDENPLNIYSHSIWCTVSRPLETLSSQLRDFNEDDLKAVPIKPLLLKRMQETSNSHKNYLESICAGRPASKSTDFDIQVITIRQERSGTKTDEEFDDEIEEMM